MDQFVSTARQKAKIQAILRRTVGRYNTVEKKFWMSLCKGTTSEVTTNVLDTLRTFHDLSNTDDLFLALGEKTIILGSKDIDEIQR